MNTYEKEDIDNYNLNYSYEEKESIVAQNIVIYNRCIEMIP